MRHKAVLFDQLRRENRSMGRLAEWIESRLTFRFSNRLWKIVLYNAVMQVLYGVERIVCTLILSVAGSLVLTSFLTSVTKGQPMTEVFLNLIKKLF